MKVKLVINYTAIAEGSHFTVTGTDKDIMEMMTIIGGGVQVTGTCHISMSNLDNGDIACATFNNCRDLKARVVGMLKLIGGEL